VTSTALGKFQFRPCPPTTSTSLLPLSGQVVTADVAAEVAVVDPGVERTELLGREGAERARSAAVAGDEHPVLHPSFTCAPVDAVPGGDDQLLGGAAERAARAFIVEAIAWVLEEDLAYHRRLGDRGRELQIPACEGVGGRGDAEADGVDPGGPVGSPDDDLVAGPGACSGTKVARRFRSVVQ